VFTVEALPDDAQPNAHILPNGRYAHGRAHLDRVLAAAGLLTLQARRDDLRHEAGQPVRGWLVAAQRPA
jgi:predicted TPR repeat methyltransferase